MSFRFSQLLRLFEREMRMMDHMLEPEYAFANRRYNNNRRYNLAAEEQEQPKSLDQMAAPKEGEANQSTQTSKSNTESKNDTSSKQNTSSRSDASSKQDTSKQQAQSSDSGKSNTKPSESSEKNVRGSRRQQGDDHTPKYYSYSYSKSYRNHNGESFSTERYSVDTPNLQFTAEKPENADQFQIEYNKTGEGEQLNKDNKIQKELSADVEDELRRWMSRINTELNYYESDFWHTPYSRRWSPFKSLEREFDRDLRLLFGELESDHGSRRRLENSANQSKQRKSLKGENPQEKSGEQGQEHERESNEGSSQSRQSAQSRA